MIMKNIEHDDPSIAYFLELDGAVHFIDENCHYRVEIKAKRTDITPERPHGLSYSLTMHDSNNNRLLGFDNAHPTPANRGPSGKKHKFHDHKHRYGRTRVYNFVDTETLISDFYKAVEQLLKDEGIKL